MDKSKHSAPTKQVSVFSLFHILVLSDIRQIFRDPTLKTFIFAPFLLLAIIRYFIPYLTSIFPDLIPFVSYLVMLGCLQTGTLFGFVTSFLILEEKDEQLIPVIRILPISATFFILYRLVIAVFMSFFGAFLILLFSNLVTFSLIQTVVLSFFFALSSPFIILIVSTFAKNKVEGMAYFKGINLVMLIPILSFLYDSVLFLPFQLVPIFWTFTLFQEFLVNSVSLTTWSFLIGVHTVILSALIQFFKKRVFEE